MSGTERPWKVHHSGKGGWTKPPPFPLLRLRTSRRVLPTSPRAEDLLDIHQRIPQGVDLKVLLVGRKEDHQDKETKKQRREHQKQMENTAAGLKGLELSKNAPKRLQQLIPAHLQAKENIHQGRCSAWRGYHWMDLIKWKRWENIPYTCNPSISLFVLTNNSIFKSHYDSAGYGYKICQP